MQLKRRPVVKHTLSPRVFSDDDVVCWSGFAEEEEQVWRMTEDHHLRLARLHGLSRGRPEKKYLSTCLQPLLVKLLSASLSIGKERQSDVRLRITTSQTATFRYFSPTSSSADWPSFYALSLF